MSPTARASVYVLRSTVDPARHYVGVTSDVERRLEFHNESPKRHTSRFRPWSLVATVWFHDPRLALRFEKYLKSGSGRAFSKRHFQLDSNPGFAPLSGAPIQPAKERAE